MPRTPNEPAAAQAPAAVEAPAVAQAAAAVEAPAAPAQAQAPAPDPAPAYQPPPATPGPGPAVIVNIPAAPVLVEEYYALDYRNEIDDPRGDRARVIPKGNRDGTDKIVRYRLQEGTGLHVRSTEARLEVRADGSKWALPSDGRPALPHGPGKPGCYGLQSPAGQPRREG